MYHIDITDCAEQDMRKAAEYIAVDLHNQPAAEQLLNDAEKAIFSLEEMPYRYPLVADEVLANQGFRFFSVDNYLVFFIVREDKNIVVIERFLYKRRDWAAILNGGQVEL